ncbi:cell division protein FtsQ/DivIB [Pseudobdellovibrio sp. HCB154]|uniref:cell division protein FtsQ/DivIB n=1 Tax=Pseudobdellovibrio sp. HCB154 TaxID=3386277 RepID=UPI0039174C85
MNWLRLRFYFRLFFIFVVVPAAVFASVYTLDQRGFFAIEEIEMKVMTKSEQLNFSKPYLDKLNQELSSYKGQSLWRLSLSQVSDKLKAKSWIKDFRISRSWPNAINVEIEPKILSLLYVDQKRLAEGFVRPVTTDGAILPEVDTAQAPPLAMLKGEVFVKDEAKRKTAVELLKSLPEEGKLSHKIISEIGFDNKEGYWVEVAKTNIKIKLGEDQFAVKSARVSQVLDYLEKRDLKARVIDANLSKKVLVRLQQTP